MAAAAGGEFKPHTGRGFVLNLWGLQIGILHIYGPPLTASASLFFFSRALFPTVESRTSVSNPSEPGHTTNTPSLPFTATPAPTGGGSTGFVYVDFEGYDEYLSYDDPPVPVGTVVQSTTAAAGSTTEHRVETVPETTTPVHTAPFTVAGAPSEGRTTVPVKWSAVPDPPTTVSVGPHDIIAASSSPNTTSDGTQPPGRIQLWAPEPTAMSSPPSFFRLPKKDNNSVDEVSYRIVGLEGDSSKGQQSYFVPRMPPVRERTQNKRIQQLLNEKRRQGVLRGTGRTRQSRTGVRL